MKNRPAFIFDIDDTAYNQLDPFRLAFEKNFSHWIGKVNLDDLYKYSRYFSDLAFEKTERGEMDIWEMRVYRITNAFQSIGIDISSSAGLAFEKDYAYFLQHIQLNPGIRKTLKFCKEQDFILGIITNGPAQRQQSKIEQLGLEQWIPKAHWIISGKVKLMKPDPKIFKYAEVKLNLSAKHTYYIGDSFANDVIGAKAAGWQAIWLNHRQRDAIDQTVAADITLADEQEVLPTVRHIARTYLH